MPRFFAADGLKFWVPMGPNAERAMSLRVGRYREGNGAIDVISGGEVYQHLTVNLRPWGLPPLGANEFFVLPDVDIEARAMSGPIGGAVPARALLRLGVVERTDCAIFASPAQQRAARDIDPIACVWRFARCQESHRAAVMCDHCHERWRREYDEGLVRWRANDAANRLRGGVEL